MSSRDNKSATDHETGTEMLTFSRLNGSNPRKFVNLGFIATHNPSPVLTAILALATNLFKKIHYELEI